MFNAVFNIFFIYIAVVTAPIQAFLESLNQYSPQYPFQASFPHNSRLDNERQ